MPARQGLKGALRRLSNQLPQQPPAPLLPFGLCVPGFMGGYLLWPCLPSWLIQPSIFWHQATRDCAAFVCVCCCCYSPHAPKRILSPKVHWSHASASSKLLSTTMQCYLNPCCMVSMHQHWHWQGLAKSGQVCAWQYLAAGTLVCIASLHATRFQTC